MSQHLCLGTVQFGLPYGVTNDIGKVPESEVISILNMAANSGIELLDTAQAYGTSEEIIGRCMPSSSKHRLISKLAANSPQETWERNLQESLKRLSTKSLDSFLLHSTDDLRGPSGKQLLGWLKGLQKRGLTNRIGVSIYSAKDLEGLPLDQFQLVQLPISIYDQRLLKDGTISFLHSRGITVHARSIFLQGLMLQSSEDWPNFLSNEFKDHHTKLQRYLTDRNLTNIEAAFVFARSCRQVEAFLIGVLNKEQLKEIIKAWNKSLSLKTDGLEDWEWSRPKDIDPREWKQIYK